MTEVVKYENAQQLPATLDKAEQAIELAKTPAEIKGVIAITKAAVAFASSYYNDQKEIKDRARALQLRAERKLGELLIVMPKAAGAATPVAQNQRGTNTVPRGENPTLAEIGIDKKESARAQALARLTDDRFAEIESGKVSVAKALAPQPKPEPIKAPEPIDDGPSADELAASEAAEQADREILAKLLDSDDALATAHAEITRLNAVNAGLQQRLNGLLNEKAEAIKLAKRESNRADRLQKELDRTKRMAA